MAMVFIGQTECPICGEVLVVGDKIWSLPPISNTNHPLWKYFDVGLHKSCYENWDKKIEVEQLLQSERRE